MKVLFLKLIGILFIISISIGITNTSFAVNLLSCNSPDITYDQAMKSNKPIVIEFYADWCGACKRFKPILNDIKTEYDSKYNFVYLNADKAENVAISSKYNVTGLPSVYIINPKTGEAKFINQDYYFTPAQFKKELDDYLKSHTN
ncbi:MAG: thioredoxin family protein [Candidatus Gastranaerophilales bacterium]|nr:thioredoxin family protein [Candidatus Gastranaerophilales bacterium]